MNDREKVIRMLRNYRSYKYAISKGVAPYQAEDNRGMPMALDYGPRIPSLTRGDTTQTSKDYKAYKSAVEAIDGAVADVLDDDEQDIIQLKYLSRNAMTIKQISDRKRLSERTAKSCHKRALTKLTMSLRFVEEPEIINLDGMIRISV